jgi:hypothetical protein
MPSDCLLNNLRPPWHLRFQPSTECLRRVCNPIETQHRQALANIGQCDNAQNFSMPPVDQLLAGSGSPCMNSDS